MHICEQRCTSLNDMVIKKSVMGIQMMDEERLYFGSWGWPACFFAPPSPTITTAEPMGVTEGEDGLS